MHFEEQQSQQSYIQNQDKIDWFEDDIQYVCDSFLPIKEYDEISATPQTNVTKKCQDLKVFLQSNNKQQELSTQFIYLDNQTTCSGPSKQKIKTYKKQKIVYDKKQIQEQICRTLKNKNGKKLDQKKNICGYILKSVIKLAISQIFTSCKQIIQQLCAVTNLSYKKFTQYYKKQKHVTGPSHIHLLFQYRLTGLLTEIIIDIKIKRVFWVFCLWLLRYKYLGHALIDGKMEKIGNYSQYKNKQLLQKLYNAIQYAQQALAQYIQIEQLLKLDSKLLDKIDASTQAFKIQQKINRKKILQKNYEEYSYSYDNLNKQQYQNMQVQVACTQSWENFLDSFYRP